MTGRADHEHLGAWRRALVAIGALSVAVAIGACGGDLGGGDGSSADLQVAKAGPAQGEFTMSTGPFYIDPGKGGVEGQGGTLDEFQKKTGVQVDYKEDINSNESFFAKLRPDLANGDSGGRDIIIATDWMAKRYADLGYVQKLDKDAIPNVEKNLLPSLQSPAFDPDRSYTVPWASGMTGLIVNTDEADQITSVNDLFDPKYHGKVTVLAELRDTIPLFLKADGIDPADATKEQWLDTIQKVKDAVESGQFRDVTGNDYITDLPRGDSVAAIGWSGDAVQLALDDPAIEFRIPDEGCILWSDDMIIPVGAENPGAAYAFMNYVYDPRNAAQIAAYVNYTTPVKGVREVFEKQGEKDLANNDLIFPSEDFTSNCSTQPSLSGDEEKEIEKAWAQVVSG